MQLVYMLNRGIFIGLASGYRQIIGISPLVKCIFNVHGKIFFHLASYQTDYSDFDPSVTGICLQKNRTYLPVQEKVR